MIHGIWYLLSLPSLLWLKGQVWNAAVCLITSVFSVTLCQKKIIHWIQTKPISLKLWLIIPRKLHTMIHVKSKQANKQMCQCWFKVGRLFWRPVLRENHIFHSQSIIHVIDKSSFSSTFISRDDNCTYFTKLITLRPFVIGIICEKNNTIRRHLGLIIMDFNRWEFSDQSQLASGEKRSVPIGWHSWLIRK